MSWVGFFCLLDFGNVYKTIDYPQVFECAMKGFPCCSISDKARKDIHCQGCGNQAAVGVWTQLQPQVGSEPMVQHWDFAFATLKSTEVKDYPLLWTQPRGMLGPVLTLPRCQRRRNECGDHTGEQHPGDLIYRRWFDPAQAAIHA